MVVEYKDYLIEQSEEELEASIYKNNRRVMHLGLTKVLESEELIASVAECLSISGLCLENETIDYGIMYDGEEPC